MKAALRRVALVLAIAALVAIGWRPTLPSRAPAVEAILATPGATDAALRRLSDSLGHPVVYADPAALRRSLRPIRRLHVAGWGLDESEWRPLEAMPIVAHPSLPPPGIVRASWPAQLALGEPFVVEGMAMGAPAGAWVFLSDPSGAVDSMLLRTDSGGGFRLHALPKAVGRQRFALHVGHRSAAESLGVVVTEVPAWRVLILESAPNFETRALRDWIVAQHGAVAVRSTVSRGRTRTEFVNRPRTALEPLTTRLLAQFDAVVTDGRTLAAVGAAERRELRRAVTTDGLGVLLVPDTSLLERAAPDPDRDFFLDFVLEPIAGLDVRLIRPRWPGLARPVTEPIRADPFTLRARFGLEALMEDGTGGIVAQVAPRGAGHIGVSLVAGAAQWERLGEHAAFSAYWSRLLSAVAGGRVEAPRWSIETPGPWLVDRPIIVAVQSPRAELTLVLVAGPSGAADSVYLTPDPLDPTRRTGTYWPREAGWYEIAGATGPVGFYAQRADAWRGRQASDRLDATARRQIATAGGEAPAALLTIPVRREIPPGWFFGLFLVAAGYLWSARRVASLDRRGR